MYLKSHQEVQAGALRRRLHPCTLQVLPELLEVLLLLWPRLMPRAALGRSFARWWAATHGGDPVDGSGRADLQEGSKSLAGKSAASLPTGSGAGSSQ